MSAGNIASSPLPVIAIDGPSASGKGTVAALVACELGFHYLDSGAIYRATAHAARQGGIALEDEAGLVELAHRIELRFDGVEVYLNGAAVGDVIRTEEAGRAASASPRVRPCARPCCNASAHSASPPVW